MIKNVMFQKFAFVLLPFPSYFLVFSVIFVVTFVWFLKYFINVSDNFSKYSKFFSYATSIFWLGETHSQSAIDLLTKLKIKVKYW